MKKQKSNLSIFGILMFFSLIAIVMQIAILVYDFIISKTENKGLIAVLILLLIIILSSLCVIIDLFRRKLTVDKPVETILDATDKIAKGDFSVRVLPLHTYDKYNQYDAIMENLNKMAAELEKSEILKTDFISNVSHEIKTPLSVIHNYAEMLQQDVIDGEERKRCLKAISQATKRLSDLITNILKLNKLENQEISPDISTFSLDSQLEEIIISYEDLIEQKNLNLECDIDSVKINSCPSYLEIVWNNLFSNAIKFTDQGGTISVKVKKEGCFAVVSFTDTGCGIDENVGKKIFDKFYQADTSRQSQGNGLGLALVKRVIDILGGEISVDSALGKGSTFTVRLKDVDYE